MRKSMQRRLTYANVVATLALFIAVGGASAFAATQLGKNSVGTKQLKNSAVTAAKIKNGAVTGAKVNVSSLPNVPSASHAASADSATNAVNAGQLGGVAASAYARGALEAVHVVGAPGEPAFEHNCANNSVGGHVGFYKDGFGIVHLTGLAQSCTMETSIFILPAGFRPAANVFIGVGNSEATSAELKILPSGAVVLFGGITPRLEGVTFRPASS